mgnify:CR=1 FL=1
MSNCYRCGVLLNDENLSQEHIIPNAFGGKLKAKILCRKCNNRFGDSIDTDLVDDLSLLTYYANPKRERGGATSLCGTYKGIAVEMDSKGGVRGFKKEPVKNGWSIVAIGEKGEKYLRDMCTGMFNKGKISPEEFTRVTKAIETSSKKLEEPLKFEFTLEKVWLGVLKTSVNYAIYSGIAPSVMAKAISILDMKDQTKAADISDYCYEGKIFCDNEIKHEILLVKNKYNQLLCFVSFYGVVRFVVLLCDNYNGGNVAKSYSFNIEKQRLEEVVRDRLNNAINFEFVKCRTRERYLQNTNDVSRVLGVFLDKFVKLKNEDIVNADLIRNFIEKCSRETVRLNRELYSKSELMLKLRYEIENKLKKIKRHSVFSCNLPEEIVDGIYKRYEISVIVSKCTLDFVEKEHKLHHVLESPKDFIATFEEYISKLQDIPSDIRFAMHEYFSLILKNIKNSTQ